METSTKVTGIVCLSAVTLGIYGINQLAPNADVATQASKIVSSSASPTASINPNAEADYMANSAACNGYAVKLDPHTGGEVITGGIPSDLSPEERVKFIAQHAKQDPAVFQSYYNDSPFVKTLHIKEPITNPADLVTDMKDGACWTADGIKLYDEWSLMWSMTDATPVPLPATGVNTGVGGGSAFQIAAGPIPAGTATKFTYHDAKGAPVGDTTSRNECGNPVSPAAIPGLPVRPNQVITIPSRVPPPPPTTHRPPPPPPPTTHRPPPPPPPTTTTPPPPVYRCPPGTTGHYPVCKDEESNGPARAVEPQQQPNPLPARPDLEEATHPDIAPPPAVYVPPQTSTVVVVPQDQGGPTPYSPSEPSPREPEVLPAPQAEAPAASAPETSCIAAPGSEC